MANYYRSNKRTARGRFARKAIDWDRLAEDLFLSVIGIWVAGTVIDIALKAHGL